MRDFASFLDDPPLGDGLAEEPVRAESMTGAAFAGPAMPFGFVGGAEAGAGAEPMRPGLAATGYIGIAGGAELRPPETAPEAIARELAIGPKADMKALDRLRREFAFGNHPDRVRAEWRDRAMIRMQIANRLIDEAKARLSRRTLS